MTSRSAVIGLGGHLLGDAGLSQIAQAGPFVVVADYVRLSRLPRDTLQALIRAGALDSPGERRDLLRQLGELQMLEGRWT